MLGKVTATNLNIRSRPDQQSKVLGQVMQDALVEIVGEQNNWFEIDFHGAPAFANAGYIRPVRSVTTLKARVTASLLNVRQAPSLTAQSVGTLSQETLVNVLGAHPDWLEIEFNHATGFVSRRHVELIDGGTPRQGVVTASQLNIRAAPNRDSEILGKLTSGCDIQILSQTGNWYETRLNGLPAYVSASHVSTTRWQDGGPSTAAVGDEAEAAIGDFEALPLAPATKYAVAGAAEGQKVAMTWNKFGGLLQALAEHHHMDVACAVAVLCVESAGKGFEQDNQNRMIIRFENHKFWEYWGKRQNATFGRHFKYNSNTPWLGHQWRSVETDPWEQFHGNQAMEWRVLEFARRLDDTAALKSISMGAPQIMGFHSARLGFASVQDMFEKFSADIRHQILGFFDFLNASRSMVPALRELDFVKFAGLYNGSGQREKYGAWIKTHYDAFKKLV